MDGDLMGMAAAASRPLADGETLSPIATASPGGLAALSTGADAEAELVKGVLNHQLVMGSRATAAASFLYAHGCGDVCAFILELRKYHQRPSGLVKALDAVSLKNFMRGLDVSLNNGK